VAAEARLGICEYTIAKNGQPWDHKFGCVWEPRFKNKGNSVLAPVRKGKIWTLAEDGIDIWSNYDQVWYQKESPDGRHIAAVVAPTFGKWTIAVDDAPWKRTYGDCVLEPFFSDDGKHVAAIVKEQNRWTIAVDGIPWNETFEMVWNPVFSPDGLKVAAKVERKGKFFIVVNGKIWSRPFDMLWEPQFSPDGKHALVRSVEDQTYYRRVVKTSELPS
jgi:hypothetical protein